MVKHYRNETSLSCNAIRSRGIAQITGPLLRIFAFPPREAKNTHLREERAVQAKRGRRPQTKGLT